MAIEHIVFEQDSALFDQSAELTQRNQNTAMRTSLRAGAYYHVDHNMGSHFTVNPKTAPGGAYGYQRRGKRYEEAKYRKFGHLVPNVRTGNLRNRIGNETRARRGITATRKRSRVVLKAYWGAMPDRQRKELEATTPDEIQGVFDQVRTTYLDFVNNNRRLRRKTL